ncbi:unnamed protein product [Darwinula stevensoni]|uniref:Snurportin-1 m3G cap-binding domain-containing protein n=1 Tax=Darwinula stevensoni TaxID=69355 RepID=A0A7R9A370_9CRUS|nr:unnamed protein product [Darwinula stevensoni]CAG0891121.1 unnamed protein product [Darwinula stevensoni]
MRLMDGIPKSISGWRALAAYGVAMVVGGKLYIYNKREVAQENVEKRGMQLAIEPLMLAESDRAYLKQIRKNMEEEEKVMADYPGGWEVGKWKNEPVFKTVPKDYWWDPDMRDYYAHTSNWNYFKRLKLTPKRSQEERRKEILQRQKELVETFHIVLVNNQLEESYIFLVLTYSNRFNNANLARKLALEESSDDDTMEERGEVEVESMDTAPIRRRQRRHQDQLMYSEWLIEVPEELEQDWLLVPCPVGKRSLVISSRTECRFFILNSRLAEIPELQELTNANRYRFRPLNWYSCGKEEIRQVLAQPVPFPGELDGLLFYHKQTHYTAGYTPLVGWLKPYMVPELLGVEVPEAYLNQRPNEYDGMTNFLKDYYQNAEERRKVLGASTNEADWHKTPEGSNILKSFTDSRDNCRKGFGVLIEWLAISTGLLEEPTVPPHLDAYSYKVFVVGKVGIGKTATIARLCGRPLPSGHEETPGIALTTTFWPVKLRHRVRIFQLAFWDAGETAARRYDHVLPECKKDADGIVFVFSMTDSASLKELPHLMSKTVEPNRKPVVIVFGTRFDSPNLEVTQRDIKDFEGKWKVPVFPVRNIPSAWSSDLDIIAHPLNILCEQLWLLIAMENVHVNVMGPLEEEELDPGVRIELENLNSCTDEINRLEMELDDANAAFRQILSESTQHLRYLSSKLGSCIEKARPYYKAKDVAKKAQMECQKAAIQFQRANGIHQAAKETISLAEERFLSQKGSWDFDSAWQEMLNHATMKVMEAEKQRAASQREHQETASFFTQAERKVQHLEGRLKRHIVKSKPYFEHKESLERQLQQQKQKIQQLQTAVTVAKQKYADSLQNLECISERIHARRKFAEEGLSSRRVRLDSGDRTTYQFDLETLEGLSHLSSPAISSTVSSDVEDEDEGFDSVSSGAGEDKTDWVQFQNSIQNLTLQMANEGQLSQEEIDAHIQECIRHLGVRNIQTAANSALVYSSASTAADDTGCSSSTDNSAEVEGAVVMPSVVKTIFAEQLCQAILEKDLWCVQAILRLGADVNHLVEEKGGVSAMHLAAGIPGDSGLEIMKTLLTHGGDPNIKSEEGLTPVHIGVIQGREWIVDLLLRNGGNPWIRDNEECDAFTYAKDQPRVIYLLQQQAQFKLQEEDSWDSLTQLRFSKVLPVKTVQSWHGSTSSLTHASCHILTSQDMTGDSTCTLGSMNVTIVEDESVQCQQDKTDPDMLHGGSCLKAKVDFQTSDGEFNRAFIKPLNNFHSISSSIFPEGEGAFSSSLSSLRSCGSVVELVYTDEEEGVVLLERRWPKDIPSVLSSSRLECIVDEVLGLSKGRAHCNASRLSEGNLRYCKMTIQAERPTERSTVSPST